MRFSGLWAALAPLPPPEQPLFMRSSSNPPHSVAACSLHPSAPQLAGQGHAIDVEATRAAFEASIAGRRQVVISETTGMSVALKMVARVSAQWRMFASNGCIGGCCWRENAGAQCSFLSFCDSPAARACSTGPEGRHHRHHHAGAFRGRQPLRRGQRRASHPRPRRPHTGGPSLEQRMWRVLYLFVFVLPLAQAKAAETDATSRSCFRLPPW